MAVRFCHAGPIQKEIMSDIESLHKVSPRQAKVMMMDILEAGLVPFIKGSPGCGKSAIVKQIAEAGNLELIDHRLSTSDPTDLNGLPTFKDGFATFAPFADTFPIQGISKTNKNGYLLFLDELNAAPKSTQASAYKLVLDRMVGQHKLHEDVHIVAAGNLASDRAITNTLSTAMQSRLVHLQVEVNFKEWMEDVAIPEKYDKRIIAFLSRYPNKLMDFSPDHQEHTFSSPRTWEFMNKLLKVSGTSKALDASKTPLYAGTITSGVAIEFVQFTRVFDSLVQLSEVMKEPERTPVPYDLNLQWATVTFLVEAVTKDNLGPICTYIDRFGISFRILFYRSLMQHNPGLRSHPKWINAMIEMQRYLND